MGLFDKIFKRPGPAGAPQGYFKTLTAYTPVFTTWGGQNFLAAAKAAAAPASTTASAQSW